ncbi:MAG TPA: fluoride efflux transporter CrcB [Puia sp.]|nr:fluoride efflux transporter CrcB [Puia sp.]
MKTLVIIALGGAAGSVARYLAQLGVSKLSGPAFPVGTFIVNLTGCFLIGLIYALAGKYEWLTLDWRLFLVTGLCGGYTTFSSFSYDSVNLLRSGNYLYFGLYVLGSVALGLLATFAGIRIIR